MKHFRYYLFLALLVSTSAICSAANNFVQRKGEAGWVFHIFSRKMPATDKSSGSIEYDFTYAEQTDSVTLLSTLTVDNPLPPKSLTAVSCGKTFESTLETIFLEPKGDKYTYRTCARFSFDEWAQLYECSSPYCLSFTFGNDKTDQIFNFGFKDSQWKSQIKDLRKVINSIKINTGK